MTWTAWKQVDLILTRAVLAVVLLTEWRPPSPTFFGWVMAFGIVLGTIVLAQLIAEQKGASHDR